jgi:hypothetical protein
VLPAPAPLAAVSTAASVTTSAEINRLNIVLPPLEAAVTNDQGEPPKRLPLISCEWTGRSRLTSLYVSQAPRTFGSRQPVSKVPSIGSVMPLVVSVIETLVYTT